MFKRLATSLRRRWFGQRIQLRASQRNSAPLQNGDLQLTRSRVAGARSSELKASCRAAVLLGQNVVKVTQPRAVDGLSLAGAGAGRQDQGHRLVGHAPMSARYVNRVDLRWAEPALDQIVAG